MKLTKILEQVYKKPWAILPSTHQSIQDLLNRKLAGESMDFPLTEEEPLTQIVGKVAVVNVAGVILPKASLLERTCGAFSLAEFKNEMASLLKNPSIETIILNIDSPGGVVTGLPEAAKFLAKVADEKNLVAFTDGQMCSAAYWLGCQASTLFATASSEVGSIGVYCAHIDQTRAMELEGLKVDLFKGGKHKAMGFPGIPLTEEERGIIQAGVDKTYSQFKQAVLANRNVDDETMQGLTYDGDEALDLGLIDSIEDDLTKLIQFYNQS